MSMAIQARVCPLPWAGHETVVTVHWRLPTDGSSAVSYTHLDVYKRQRLVVAAAHEAEREVVLKVSDLAAAQVDAQLLAKIGIVGPFSRPVIGEVMADGAALQAGLKDGDEVLSVNGNPMVDGQQLRQFIRNSASSGQTLAQTWNCLLYTSRCV